MTVDDLLALLPADVASEIRLVGGERAGIVLVLRFDGDDVADLEIARPFPF